MGKFKRQMPYYGEGDDQGKWFRCWNCGFRCKVDRDSLDTGDHGSGGVTVTSTVIDGDTVHYPDIIGGCPFCGNKNYK